MSVDSSEAFSVKVENVTLSLGTVTERSALHPDAWGNIITSLQAGLALARGIRHRIMGTREVDTNSTDYSRDRVYMVGGLFNNQK